MRTIYKYLLNPDHEGIATFTAPNGLILKVAMQNAKPHAWIEHDTDEAPREYKLRFVATGEVLPDKFNDDWLYHETVFLYFNGNQLVFHVYENVGL